MNELLYRLAMGRPPSQSSPSDQADEPPSSLWQPVRGF